MTTIILANDRHVEATFVPADLMNSSGESEVADYLATIPHFTYRDTNGSGKLVAVNANAVRIVIDS